MALEVVESPIGLWRDPLWTPSTPGVYALIIGASAYPHLGGGSTPAPETHGLEQLVSSASTAAALFDWLRHSFRRHDLPVVWCYLLLSPTEKERAEFEQAGLRHYAEPNDATVRRAIQYWTGNVPRQAPASSKSRTLFFFSGHGVQVNCNALLLPSDYLNPDIGDPHFENCISAGELRKWMEESPVAEHLALIDACRNEFSPLASKGATAHGAFPINPPGGVPPRTAASLAATSPNAVAYQLPGRPYTFFGQAVLEALSGIADTNDSRVEFRELVDYVKPRVNTLLKEAAGTALDQTVRPTIDGDDELVVTELVLAKSVSLESPQPARLRSLGPRPVNLSAAAEAAVSSRFDSSLRVRDPIALSSIRASGEAFRRFGHEYASEVWNQGGVACYSMADGGRIDNGAVIMAVERDDRSSVVQVDLALESQAPGVLLAFEGAANVQRERLAAALPTDNHGRVPIRLTLTIGPFDRDEPPKIQRLDARLGPCDWNPHYEYLWSLTREADLGSLAQAAALADPHRLESAARDKMNGPTAATAGMLLLARAGAIERVKDWTRNLMEWFPWIPDGGVLWAASLRDRLTGGDARPYGVKDPIDAIAAALETLLSRGLPFFADTLELASGLVRYTLRADISVDRRERLSEIARWIDRTSRVAMPCGHFMVLAGVPRPEWLSSEPGALSVREMVRALRRAD